MYTTQQVDELTEGYLSGKDRGELDPIADACVAPYLALSEDGQVTFKGSAKTFARLYAFLSQVLPYSNAEWEKLSIFLNFLIPKLPAPEDEDFSKGILETRQHGQLPSRKAGSAKAVPRRRGCRDRTDAHGRRR